MLWLAAVGLVAVSATAQGAFDPRQVDATTLALSDWLNLRRDDRQLFMEGFAIGWHGPVHEKKAETFSDAREGFEALNLAVVKLANTPARGHLLVATILARAQIVGRMPLALHTDRNWRVLPVRHRLFLLRGVRGGIYARAVWEKLGPGANSHAIDDALKNSHRAPPPPRAFDPLRMLTDLDAFIAENIRQLAIQQAAEIAAAEPPSPDGEDEAEDEEEDEAEAVEEDETDPILRTPLIESISAVVENRLR